MAIDNTSDIFAVTLSPDGNTIAIAYEDRTVRLWDITDRASPEPSTTITRSNISTSLIFDPTGRFLTATGDDLRMWAVSIAGRPVETLRATGPQTDGYLSQAFSPDGHVHATGKMNTIELRAFDPDKTTTTDVSTPGPIEELAFSQNNRFLAAAGNFGTIRLWDLTSPRGPTEIAALPQRGEITALALTSDDHRLIVAVRGEAPILWNLDTPHAEKAGALAGTDLDYNIQVSPDGTKIAFSAFDDTDMYVTTYERVIGDTKMEKVVDQLCDRFGPRINETQWGRYFPSMMYQSPCR